jgi:hypothetical protein
MRRTCTRLCPPAGGLAPGEPARMAARIIDSVDMEPAPLRIVLGSQALESRYTTLRARIADFEAQRELAASTDSHPAGEEAHPCQGPAGYAARSIRAAVTATVVSVSSKSNGTMWKPWPPRSVLQRD